MNPWNTWIGPAFWHAVGALAIQAFAVLFLALVVFNSSIFIPAYWWIGALAGGGFFALREFWQMRHATPPVWWQNRTPWDVGAAVVPVVAAAVGSHFT